MVETVAPIREFCPKLATKQKMRNSQMNFVSVRSISWMLYNFLLVIMLHCDANVLADLTQTNTINYQIFGLYGSGKGGLGTGKFDSETTPAPVVDSSTLRIVQVASGDQHTVFTTENNRIFSFGTGYGTGSSQTVRSPQEFSEFSGRLGPKVYAAAECTIVTFGREIWGFGRASYGELGTPSGIVSPRTLSYSGLLEFDTISMGERHVLALARNGSVFSWGSNEDGQLMISSLSSYAPTLIDFTIRKKILKIFAFGRNSFFVTQYGELFGVGKNTYGILPGNPLDTTVRTPLKLNVGNLSEIVQISTAATHVLFLKTDGFVYGLGRNSFGELGVVATSELKRIPLFSKCDAIGTSFGKTWCFIGSDALGVGKNEYGELGTGFKSPSDPYPFHVIQPSGSKKFTGLSGGIERSIFISAECFNSNFTWRNGLCGPLFPGFDIKTKTCAVDSCGHGYCDVLTDSCICDWGWNGETCSSMNNDMIGLILGLIIGPIVLLAVIFLVFFVVVGLVLYQKRFYPGKDLKTHPIYHEMLHQAVHHDPEISHDGGMLVLGTDQHENPELPHPQTMEPISVHPNAIINRDQSIQRIQQTN